MTAITFRRNSADNRRQKKIKVTILSFNPGEGVAMRARPSPSRKFKRDHVCAICDGCHGLTLAGFDNASHVVGRFGPEHG